jgi:hypothetical protein
VRVCPACGGVLRGLRVESVDSRVPIPNVIRRERHSHREAEVYVAACLAHRFGRRYVGRALLSPVDLSGKRLAVAPGMRRFREQFLNGSVGL